MKKIILLALAVFGGVAALFTATPVSAIASSVGDTYSLAAGTWTVPSDVIKVRVEAWGGGGGGGNGAKTHNHNISGFGGGGGGYVSKDITVTPGDVYNISVGRGGKGYQTGGVAFGGGRSSFLGNGSAITAGGGGAGKSGVDGINSGSAGTDGEGPGGGAGGYTAVYGGGGAGLGGDTNLTGANGGPYARSADNSNPFASDGGAGANGGGGGSRGRLGRDGGGCCQGTDTWAKDGNFPGGGGGGSDTGTGGYGADGKVIVTVLEIKSSTCTDASAKNFNQQGDCVYVPRVSLASSKASAWPLQSFDLTWSSEHADSCTASGDWSTTGSVGTSGSATERLFVSDKTFTISCTGSGGEANKSVTVPLFKSSGPSIDWTANPKAVACDSTYTVSAKGSDADGLLSKVSIDKDGVPFAYAGGGDGYTNTSGNPTSDSGPKSVTFTAWSEDSQGTQSAKISTVVQIGINGSCTGAAGCTDQTATNYDPNAKVDNGSCKYVAPSASLSVSSTCITPNSNITFTSTASGHAISSHAIEKDSNQDGVFGALKDFGSQGGTQTYSTSLGEGLYDFKTTVVAANGTAQSPVTRVTVSNSCSQSFMCSIIPSLCPPAPISAPDLSSYTWYSDDPSSWPTLSTPSALNANQSMRAKTISPDAHYYNKNLGVNSGRLTSSPPPQSTQMQIYVYDYAQAQIVASKVVNVTITTKPNGNGNNGPGNGNPSGPAKCSDASASNFGQVGPCLYPSFTISASPSVIKAKSLAGYSGALENEVHISVNPVSGFSAPVRIDVDPSSIASPTKPEFSFAGGSYSSTSPSGTLTWDGSFYRNAGLIYLPVRVRFDGVIPKGQSTITFKATALPGGLGAGQSATASVTVDSNPLYPGYQEQ